MKSSFIFTHRQAGQREHRLTGHFTPVQNVAALQPELYHLLCSCTSSQYLLHHQHVCQLQPWRYRCCRPQGPAVVPTLCAPEPADKQTANPKGGIPGFQSSGHYCGCTQSWQQTAWHYKPSQPDAEFTVERSRITWEGRKDTRARKAGVTGGRFPSLFPLFFLSSRRHCSVPVLFQALGMQQFRKQMEFLLLRTSRQAEYKTLFSPLELASLSPEVFWAGLGVRK